MGPYRQVCGEDHTVALNPVTDRDEVAQLAAEVAELAALSRAVIAGTER